MKHSVSNVCNFACFTVYSTLLNNLSKNCSIVTRSLSSRHQYVKKSILDEVVGITSPSPSDDYIDKVLICTAIESNAARIMNITNSTLLIDMTKRNSSKIDFDTHFFRKLMDNGNDIHIFCDEHSIVEILPSGYSILVI